MDTDLPTAKKTVIDVLAIASVSGVLALVILFNGIPSGNDLPEHYRFAQTFYSSLADGTLYPSWASNVNFGFGDVGVRFYPPFSYYVRGAG